MWMLYMTLRVMHFLQKFHTEKGEIRRCYWICIWKSGDMLDRMLETKPRCWKLFSQIIIIYLTVELHLTVTPVLRMIIHYGHWGWSRSITRTFTWLVLESPKPANQHTEKLYKSCVTGSHTLLVLTLPLL